MKHESILFCLSTCIACLSYHFWLTYQNGLVFGGYGSGPLEHEKCPISIFSSPTSFGLPHPDPTYYCKIRAGQISKKKKGYIAIY